MCVTAPEPLAGPRARVVSHQAGEVVMTWEELALEEQRGFITHYSIYVRAQGAPQRKGQHALCVSVSARVCVCVCTCMCVRGDGVWGMEQLYKVRVKAFSLLLRNGRNPPACTSHPQTTEQPETGSPLIKEERIRERTRERHRETQSFHCGLLWQHCLTST